MNGQFSQIEQWRRDARAHSPAPPAKKSAKMLYLTDGTLNTPSSMKSIFPSAQTGPTPGLNGPGSPISVNQKTASPKIDG